MPKKGAKRQPVDATTALLAAQDYSADEEEERYEVEAIIGDKIVSGISTYLVKWRGYGPEHNTWEPEANLVDCDLHLKTYRDKKSSAKQPESTLKIIATQANGHRGKAKRLVPDQPDDRSSSSSVHSAGLSSSQLTKRQVTGTRLNAAAAAAVIARAESDESEDLPLAIGTTDKNDGGSRHSSRMRSASKLGGNKNDNKGSEEIEALPPGKVRKTPVSKTTKLTSRKMVSSVKKPSLLDDSSDEEIVVTPKVIPKTPSVKKVSLVSSSEDEEVAPPKASAAKKMSEEDKLSPPKVIPKASVSKKSDVESSEEEKVTSPKIITKGRDTLKRAAATLKMNTPQGGAVTKKPKKAAKQKVGKDGEVEDATEYEVERIIGAVYGQGNKHWVLVFWKGFALVDCTWEPVANLGNAKWELERFYKTFGKPSGKKPRIMTEEGNTFEKKFGENRK